MIHFKILTKLNFSGPDEILFLESTVLGLYAYVHAATAAYSIQYYKRVSE